jgi:uncharacterized protein
MIRAYHPDTCAFRYNFNDITVTKARAYGLHFARMLKRLLWFSLFAIATAAQESTNTSNPPLHTVRASAEAVIMARPDRAEVNLAVSNKAETAQAAAAENAKTSQKLLDAVKPLVNATGQIRTSGYNLNPDYEYPQGGPPKLTGYRAMNSILVTLDDLNSVGKIIDTAVQAGATNVEGVSFTIRNDDTYRSQALAEAAQKARSSAEAIAQALNVRVIGVLDAQIVEAPPVHPIALARMVSAGPAPTPITTGPIEVRASVSVTLQVEPAAAAGASP